MAKILVIDDVATNRELIVTLLAHFGHKMLEAGDGGEGLEIVRAEEPDLVIVDIVMPTMSGYEFVSRLRQEPLIASTRVIFYSATFQEGETNTLARACGVSHILPKPGSPEGIVRIVNEVLSETPRTAPGPSGELRSAVDVVQLLNNRLFEKNKQLSDLNARLEQMVAERTADLEETNKQLREQIMEREKAEEHLRQIQKLEEIGRLAGGVAHDFNNLLGVILGRCEILFVQPSLDAEVLRSAKIIEEAAGRGAKLTRQLLAFGRRQLLEPRILDLNEVIAGLERMLQRLIGEDVDLKFHPEPRLARVKADPGQLEQVIMNLAVNARDAMPDGGHLTITTTNVQLDETYLNRHTMIQPGSYVMIAVSDSGCGMDAETQSHIFEPFFTTKEKGKGTGLGLSTAYGIVKQSGGYIWVYSEPGQGTTFKIYLPATAGHVSKQLPREPSARPLEGSETVLVVEDDAALRELTREFLQSSGYKVLEAGTPEEALRVAAQHSGRIDLLLTDVIMPKMNGRELAKKLLSVRPEMKVLYISGYTDDAIMRHGLLEEGLAFLQKPYTHYGLTHKIREVLGGGDRKRVPETSSSRRPSDSKG